MLTAIQATIIIQRWYRQLKRKKQREHDNKVKKMKENFDYFDNLYYKCLEESQIIISYYWRKFIKRKSFKIDLKYELDKVNNKKG